MYVENHVFDIFLCIVENEFVFSKNLFLAPLINFIGADGYVSVLSTKLLLRQFSQKRILYQNWLKIITSRKVEKTALGFLDAASLQMFDFLSNSFPVFFNTFF